MACRVGCWGGELVVIETPSCNSILAVPATTLTRFMNDHGALRGGMQSLRRWALGAAAAPAPAVAETTVQITDVTEDTSPEATAQLLQEMKDNCFWLSFYLTVL